MAVNRMLVSAVLLLFQCSPDALRAQPVAEPLPAPTGPHKTGRTSFHWRDTARAELETSAPDDRRELMVHLFYPTDANVSGARAAYIPDAEVMRGPWNDARLSRVSALRAYSVENAILQRGRTRFPVAIFSPGGGMKGLSYHALLEDLASHGWVVAAIDPPYNARGVGMPDGRVLGNLPQSERGWPAPRNAEEELRYYRERTAHWARDVSFVIDQLTALDRGAAGRGSQFSNRLDLQRGVGAFGHSRGGQAAGMVRILDSRVRAGINLDGTVGDYPIQPVNGDTTGGTQPFLWIQKTLESPSDGQLQRAGRTRAEFQLEVRRIIAIWHRRLGQVKGGAIRAYIDRPGITHIDFSDEPLWDDSMSPDARAGKLQTIADTRAWVRAFFDGTVRGERADLERLVGNAGRPPSEVTAHVFGMLLR